LQQSDQSKREQNPQQRTPVRLSLIVLAVAMIGGGVYFFTRDRAPDGFVRIPAGSFDMGSPTDERGRHQNETLRRVTLTRPFFLQTTEVTQAAYQRLMGTNPSRFNQCPQCPVEKVSWFDAIGYVNALSKQEKLPACYDPDGKVIDGESVYDCLGYRLPTEAEWEFAARAGSVDRRHGELEKIAWYSGNSGSRTHPVSTKEPNEFGLYDMHGNVFEWCHDWYGESLPTPATNPQGAASGPGRVFRGGAWGNSAKSVRAAYRFRFNPSIGQDFYGFRVARTVPLKAPSDP